MSLPIDLSDVNENDLVSELRQRHKAILILTLDNQAEKDEINEAVTHHYWGGRCACIGMAYQFLNRMREPIPSEG